MLKNMKAVVFLMVSIAAIAGVFARSHCAAAAAPVLLCSTATDGSDTINSSGSSHSDGSSTTHTGDTPGDDGADQLPSQRNA